MVPGKNIEIVLPTDMDFSILQSEKKDGESTYTIEVFTPELKLTKSFIFQMHIYQLCSCTEPKTTKRNEYREIENSDNKILILSERWHNSVFKGSYSFSKKSICPPLSSEHIYTKSIVASSINNSDMSFDIIYNYITTETNNEKVDQITKLEEKWLKSFAAKISICNI